MTSLNCGRSVKGVYILVRYSTPNPSPQTENFKNFPLGHTTMIKTFPLYFSPTSIHIFAFHIFLSVLFSLFYQTFAHLLDLPLIRCADTKCFIPPPATGLFPDAVHSGTILREESGELNFPIV